MTHQDQAVVLGVLQCFGVIPTGQPWGEGGEHRFQRQLLWRAVVTAFMSQWDVGELMEAVPPTESDSHEFSLERVEIGGFGV